jgi:hypothetical protein
MLERRGRGLEVHLPKWPKINEVLPLLYVQFCIQVAWPLAFGERPSNQVSNNRRRQRTSMDGSSRVGYVGPLAGQAVTWLQTKRPPVQSGHPVKGFHPPTCPVIGLPDLIVVSELEQDGSGHERAGAPRRGDRSRWSLPDQPRDIGL